MVPEEKIESTEEVNMSDNKSTDANVESMNAETSEVPTETEKDMAQASEKEAKRERANDLLDLILSFDSPLIKLEERPLGPYRPIEEIICVFGVATAGKSTYIFSKYEVGTDVDDVIDIFSYQKRESYPAGVFVNPTLQTYLSYPLFEYAIANTLQETQKSGSKTGRLVIEGTFLKKARRAPLLQTIKNYAHPNAKIRCVWLASGEKEGQYLAYDGESVYEIPTEDEGFSEVTILTREDVKISDEGLARISDTVNEHKSRDEITAGDLLGYAAFERYLERTHRRQFEHEGCNCADSDDERESEQKHHHCKCSNANAQPNDGQDDIAVPSKKAKKPKKGKVDSSKNKNGSSAKAGKKNKKGKKKTKSNNKEK